MTLPKGFNVSGKPVTSYEYRGVPPATPIVRSKNSHAFAGLASNDTTIVSQSVYVWMLEQPRASTARTVNLAPPFAVGVPESVPFGASVSPGGRAPSKRLSV